MHQRESKVSSEVTHSRREMGRFSVSRHKGEAAAPSLKTVPNRQVRLSLVLWLALILQSEL